MQSDKVSKLYKPAKAQTGFHGYHITRVVIYAFLAFLLVICLFPFLMMIVNATRSASQINTGFSLIPGQYFKSNFALLKDYVDVARGMLNSLVIATLSTILTAYFTTLTAYGFEFYHFKGKKYIFGFLVLMMMVPAQLGMIGYYQLILNLKMINSYFPLIITAVANLFGMFFIRQYMASVIHPALIEAARIDGSSELAIFHKIIFPLAVPATATMTIMAFIGSWNEYMRPLMLITSIAKKPLPVMVGALRGSKVAQSNFGAMYAAVTVSVIPIIIVFVLFSRYIVSSISAGGVKE